MKTKIFILAAMSFTIVGFAQKSELKVAAKALKGGDSMAAKTALEGASSLISGADAKVQSQYYYLRGQAYIDLAKKGDDAAFEEAVSSYKQVIDIEEKSGKNKYSADVNTRMSTMATDFVNAAVTNNEEKKFKEAAKKLYMGYKLSPKDTTYLYYAASSAVNGGHYEEALKYYNELQQLGYDGSEQLYKATNNKTGEVEQMEGKVQRDLMVKSGSHKNPVDEKTESKTAEIVKNMAIIYGQLGQDDKALEAYQVARKDNPNDVNLILQEANLHYKLGDKDKFKVLMSEASAMAPDNADLQYNIGVINMEQGNLVAARTAYQKALEINPGYTNAQLNLSTTYVNEGNALVDEMNLLGNSRTDVAKYDELKQQKDDLFNVGAKVLEDALKLNPDNQGVITQLKNIYGAMGDNENFARMKKLLGE